MKSRAIGLLDQVTSAVAGPALGLNGRAWELGTGGKLNQNDFVPVEVVIQGIGITSGATVVIETAPRAPGGPSVWTAWGSPMVFGAGSTGTSKRVVGKLTQAYIRVRVSAYTDGTYSAYLKNV